jgi:Holliday junction resolvase
VLEDLNKIGYAFKKEAKSIRGLPDVLACVQGHFVALEIKRNRYERQKETGRIALQRYVLDQMREQGAFAALVSPENWDQVLREIHIHCGVPLEC